MIALHACKFTLIKHRKGNSSIISAPLGWDFESECHSAMHKCDKSVSKDKFRLVSSTPIFMSMSLFSNANTATTLSFHPRIIKTEALDFESSPRIHISTQALTNATRKLLPLFECKEMMAMLAIRIGYG